MKGGGDPCCGEHGEVRKFAQKNNLGFFGPSPAKRTLKMILACELYGLNMSFVFKTWSPLQLGDFFVLEILSLSETATTYTRVLCLINLNPFTVPVSVWDDANSFPHN